MYSNNKITGIIDFEWSIFGDPAYDFAVLELAVEEYNPIKAIFEKYYGKVNKHFERRKDLCKILYLVELINVDKLHWKSKFREKMLEQLDELINKLSTNQSQHSCKKALLFAQKIRDFFVPIVPMPKQEKNSTRTPSKASAFSKKSRNSNIEECEKK